MFVFFHWLLTSLLVVVRAGPAFFELLFAKHFFVLLHSDRVAVIAQRLQVNVLRHIVAVVSALVFAVRDLLGLLLVPPVPLEAALWPEGPTHTISHI